MSVYLEACNQGPLTLRASVKLSSRGNQTDLVCMLGLTSCVPWATLFPTLSLGIPTVKQDDNSPPAG